MKDFVYINTAKTMEQQVFTAAHEMGHVWNVYRQVASIVKEKGMELDVEDEAMEEMITNRFAAELLMPEKVFREKTYEYVDEHNLQSQVSVVDLLKMIAKHVMDRASFVLSVYRIQDVIDEIEAKENKGVESKELRRMRRVYCK